MFHSISSAIDGLEAGWAPEVPRHLLAIPAHQMSQVTLGDPGGGIKLSVTSNALRLGNVVIYLILVIQH